MVDLFDVVVARKLSGGGGGGGSSDFSTAEVTITDNASTDGVSLWIPNVVVAEGMSAITPQVATFGMGTTANAVVPLYGNGAVAQLDAITAYGATISTSGNITQIDGTIYLITGDCTITIS